MYVRSYFKTWNLGDAIQTVALSRLLPSVEAWPGEDRADGRPFVANGWLGRQPLYPATTVYAGIYVSSKMPEHYVSVAASKHQVGVRDPHTLVAFTSRGYGNNELVGCASLTLPRYNGARSGELHVDDGTPDCKTNSIKGSMSWPSQWVCALDRLERQPAQSRPLH